eukprot:TRINITY_DN46047_c0_g1_i1.p1 TRINITY_DN46047_c0_g1~~TRINITY_DN46047_c0_g1_i1.p1  ORF type:complete len:410 (-),score=69.35 TRINITY_DN46047_c0_g1_i1:234-1463(-)
MQRKHRKKDDEHVENAPYTTVDKDGRVVWEPGLPAMVTARRQHKPQKKVDPEEAQVVCDLKAVLKMSSEAKPDWLYKALKAVPKGRANIQDVYNAVTHPKFTSGVTEWHGQRMLRLVKDHISLFSEKQHRTLTVKCDLAAQFRSPTPSRSPSRGRGERSGGAASRRSVSRSPDDGDARREESRDGPGHVGEGAPASSSREPVSEETPQERELRLRDQRERMARAKRELDQQRLDDIRRQEDEKRKQDEKERQRKAKLGGAFKLDDDEDDEPVHSAPSLLALTRSSDRAPSGLDVSRAPGGPGSKNSNPHFVEAMGGNKVLHEVHSLLMQKVAPENRRLAAVRDTSRDSRSRSRSNSRRRSGGRRATGRTVGASGSLRSPTPDGRARGQARAARKAKMIASCLGMRGVPR